MEGYAESNEYAEYMATMEYETRTHTVYCDLCPEQASGSEMMLRRSGWSLGPGYEFCPAHQGA